jgi:hypothetical protein
MIFTGRTLSAANFASIADMHRTVNKVCFGRGEWGLSENPGTGKQAAQARDFAKACRACIAHAMSSGLTLAGSWFTKYLSSTSMFNGIQRLMMNVIYNQY